MTDADTKLSKPVIQCKFVKITVIFSILESSLSFLTFVTVKNTEIMSDLY